MLQLHVLGPAFGLPSIHAECNASIALLKAVLPKANVLWELVPSHDERHVPCLVDGSESHSGFRNIARSISKRYPGYLPALDNHQLSDSIALTSFLDTHGPLLLSIQLFVSFDNYRTATRPAFTAILPWMTNYILPPRLRSQARAATEHLGISGIDIDNVHEGSSNASGQDLSINEEAGFEKAAQKRASLLLPKRQTLKSLLAQPQHAAIFKLHNLAENFLEPLKNLLGDNAWLLGTNQPTLPDFLAYGYLGLILKPNVPQDWLAKLISKKYSALTTYVDRMHEMLQLETKVDDVMSLSYAMSKEEVASVRRYCGMSLPWTAPQKAGIAVSVGRGVKHLIASIPIINDNAVVIQMNPRQLTIWQKSLPVLLTTITTATAFGVWYAFSTGRLVWPHGEQVHIFGRKRLSDYGHLGAALSGIALVGQQTSTHDSEIRGPQAEQPAIIDVEVTEKAP